MKKILILIVLSIISYCLYAEVNTKVYNNYLIFSYPELSPHSIPIKRQEILSTIPSFRLIFNKVAGENAIIESDKYGLITFISKKNIGTWQIDYEKKIRLFSNYSVNLTSNSKTARTSKYNITFNKNNDIQEESLSKNDFFDIKSIYNYDEDKKLINSINKVNLFNVVDKISYTDKNLAKLIQSTEVSGDDDNREIIEFMYDNNNKLIQTKQSKYLGENKGVINMDCYFSAHNEHGDWTKGYCIQNEKNMGNFTRQLEY